MSDERLSVLFDRDPRLALKAKFDRSKHWGKRRAFMYTTVTGIDGVGYGSYKDVDEDDLKYRSFDIELRDYDVSLHFTDCLFVPRGSRYVMKEMPREG